MIKGGIGGASTKTGLAFEQKMDLASSLNQVDGFKVKDNQIFYYNNPLGKLLSKRKFYSFLKQNHVNWEELISRQLLPDEAIYLPLSNRMVILEMKYQTCAGSVDEKLQTCDFKKKQYTKLLAPLKIQVEYYYILNDWYKQPCYGDVLDYIQSVGCNYYFNEIPLNILF